MPEPNDEFDTTLRDRIGAAEARVRVSSTPPAEPSAAPRSALWLRPALVLATAAAGAVLAIVVIGQLPDRSAGDGTPSPSAEDGVSASARSGDFVLTLSSPRSTWTTEDDVQVTATLSYEGNEPEVEIGGGGGPVVFSLRQLEGGNAVLGGGQDLPCLRYAVGPDSPLVWPFEKSGAVSEEPPFNLAFFQEPGLQLPPGRWEARAFLQYGVGKCGDLRLEVSIQLDVLEGAGPPGPSAAATEPPGTSSPEPSYRATPNPESDGPAAITGVLAGDEQLEGGCFWLRDASGIRWEILWPDGYRTTFRDGAPVLLRDGRIVAEAGYEVTVRGRSPSGVGSHCMVGIVYEADTVEVN